LQRPNLQERSMIFQKRSIFSYKYDWKEIFIGKGLNDQKGEIFNDLLKVSPLEKMPRFDVEIITDNF
jgi:hypothetical protein